LVLYSTSLRHQQDANAGFQLLEHDHNLIQNVPSSNDHVSVRINRLDLILCLQIYIIFVRIYHISSTKLLKY